MLFWYPSIYINVTSILFCAFTLYFISCNIFTLFLRSKNKYSLMSNIRYVQIERYTYAMHTTSACSRYSLHLNFSKFPCVVRLVFLFCFSLLSMVYQITNCIGLYIVGLSQIEKICYVVSYIYLLWNVLTFKCG